MVIIMGFFFSAFNTITNISPYMARRLSSFITRLSIFTECFNCKAFFKGIWHWLEHRHLSWKNRYFFLFWCDCHKPCLVFPKIIFLHPLFYVCLVFHIYIFGIKVDQEKNHPHPKKRKPASSIKLASSMWQATTSYIKWVPHKWHE